MSELEEQKSEIDIYWALAIFVVVITILAIIMFGLLIGNII